MGGVGMIGMSDPQNDNPLSFEIVMVVVASVEVPVTANVPFEVSELVKIPSVALRSAVKNEPVEVALVNEAETALKSDAKKLDEVAFVVEALST